MFKYFNRVNFYNCGTSWVQTFFLLKVEFTHTQKTYYHSNFFIDFIKILFSVQQIVIHPANRNRNRFVEPTSVQIGIGIFHESQNLQIGIGKVFVRWEVFANYSHIPEIYFVSYIIFK